MTKSRQRGTGRQTMQEETRRGTDESPSADASVEISRRSIPHILRPRGDPAASGCSGSSCRLRRAMLGRRYFCSRLRLYVYVGSDARRVQPVAGVSCAGQFASVRQILVGEARSSQK